MDKDWMREVMKGGGIVEPPACDLAEALYLLSLARFFEYNSPPIHPIIHSHDGSLDLGLAAVYQKHKGAKTGIALTGECTGLIVDNNGNGHEQQWIVIRGILRPYNMSLDVMERILQLNLPNEVMELLRGWNNLNELNLVPLLVVWLSKVSGIEVDGAVFEENTMNYNNLS